MRLSFVHFIFIAVMIGAVVTTRYGMGAAPISTRNRHEQLHTNFNVTGTIKCQNAPPWCYTVQLLELDSISNDVVGSVTGCEITNPSQDFQLEDWQLWDGVVDGNFELELLIKHDCGLEITDEKQSLSLPFGRYSTARMNFERKVKIDLSKNTAEIIGLTEWERQLGRVP
ncbi:unnamed protein product [Caenorhabditis nigoni]